MDVLDYSERVHSFMRGIRPLDEAGRAELHELATYRREDDASSSNYPHRATFCLQSACSYGHLEAAIALAEEYGADLYTAVELVSDRHKGQTVRHGLLDETLSCFRLRPDVDRSAEGRSRVMALTEYLLRQGVRADLNADPMEGPVLEAAQLMRPQAASDPASPEFDWISSMGLAPGESPEPFDAPYRLLQKYAPETVEAYEKALAAEPPPMSEEEQREWRACFGRAAKPANGNSILRGAADMLGRIAQAIVPKGP